MYSSKLLPVVAKEAIGSECNPTTLVTVNMGYTINGKTILAGINAIFEPQKLTALMGSSGAGKTTMLNTLAARSPGTRSGEILVNGSPTTLEEMRLLLSYMPQEDVLYMQLTVRQSLYYAALMRCPREWDDTVKRSRADTVMARLGIMHVADQTVDSVSGGQRKRTSAAMEFIASRPLLFMDEPTSGLDAATAKALVDTLQSAAHEEARTVISTIHQPSWTLMTKFDTIVLLAPRGEQGGSVVYHGQPSELPRYFTARGSPVPTGTNPADHLMYVLKEQGGVKWVGLWQASTEYEQVVDATQRAQRSPKESLDPSLSSLTESDKGEFPYPISYWEQYRVLCMRAAYLWIFDRQQGPLMLKMLIAVNAQIVLLLTGMTNNLSKANTLLYFTVTEYTMALSPLVILMPLEKAVVLREYRNGVFSAPVYWMARVTIVIAHALVVATFTTSFTYPLCTFPVTPFPAKLIRFWCAQALYMSTLMVLGLAVGTKVPSALAGVKAISAPLIPWIVTAGVTPPLSKIREPMQYLHYPNPLSWGVKLSLTIAFTRNGEKARDTLVHGIKMHPGNANSCYWALAICFGVVFAVGLYMTHTILNQPDKSAGQRVTKKVENGSASSGVPSAVAKEVSESTISPLLKAPNYGAMNEVPSATTVRSVPIELKTVTYRHPGSSKKVAIDSVSVCFEAGTATVLMGPSGAGKTTILNLLSGRLPTGTYVAEDGDERQCLTGDVLVDKQPTALDAFKKLGTVTPQDDVLNDVLTVQQTLAYTAEMRLPQEWPYAQKMARVDSVIRELGLEHNRHNVVGSTLKVGISGGQKKRLSIAMDLLAELPIMLVDEPTTGLDAAMALDVVECLVSLATNQHRTIICTVHQPPWSTVLKFDQLVVLAKGQLVYESPPHGLPRFLSNAGLPVPENENPADHIMDILVNQRDEFMKFVSRAHEEKKVATGSSVDVARPLEPFHESGGGGYAVSEFMQYWILTRRFSYVFIIDPDQLPEVFLPGAYTCLVNGLAFRNFGINTYTGGAILYNLIAHSMTCSNGVSLNIPNERDLVLREFQNGTYSVRAYWYARATVIFWVAIAMGIPWITIWYTLVGFPGRLMPILHTWLGSTLNALVLSLVGSVIGLVCKTELAAGQVFLPIGDATTIYAGLLITKRFIRPYALPIYYGLPISYAFEIVSTAILEHKGEDGDAFLDYYKFHASNRRFDYMILTIMIAFWVFIGHVFAHAMISGDDSSVVPKITRHKVFSSLNVLSLQKLLPDGMFAKSATARGTSTLPTKTEDGLPLLQL